MSVLERKQRGPYHKSPIGHQTATGILDAIEQERKKRGLSTREVSRLAGRDEQSYKSAMNRGGANLVTVAAFCEVLGIDIVLVDLEGRALT